MPAERPLLYAHWRSGNCYKPALMLALCGTDFDYRQVDLQGGETRRPDYRAINRFREVPVLEVDGRRICQSTVILTYLADRAGTFGGRDAAERGRIAEWLAWENQRLLGSVTQCRFMRNFMTDVPLALLDFFTERSEAALGFLDETLCESAYLTGAEPTIADIASCAYLYWLDQAGLDAARWPAVGSWLDRIAALPGWQHPDRLLPRQSGSLRFGATISG